MWPHATFLVMTKPPVSNFPTPDDNSADDYVAPEIISSHLVSDSQSVSANNFSAEDEEDESEHQNLATPASRSPFDSLLARRSRSHPEILVAGAFAAVLCAGAGFQYWQHRNDAPIVAPTTRTASAPVSNAQVVSAADTLLIKQSAGGTYSTLRGKMRAAGVVTGQAPMAGQVSRVMFKVGQSVQVGDRILTLTGGPIAAAPRGVERLQDKAEAAQVAAVKGQQSVANQISQAHTSYKEARLRVEAAEKRLSEARTILSRLRNGEEIPLPASVEKKPKAGKRRTTRRRANAKTVVSQSNPQRVTAQRERDAAIAAAVKAQKAAEAATSEAKAAFRAAAATDSVVREKRARVESARSALREIESKFAAGKNKASDVDTARGELASALAEADEALDKTKVARETSNRLDREAQSERAASEQAASRAAAALQKLQMFSAMPNTTSSAQETAAPSATSEATPDSGPRLMTARDAVDMVRDAINESEAAARNARRWKIQIDSYGDKVKQTSRRIEDSSEQLMKAQQRVMDVTIERNLSIVRAPASGVIQSIANVADNVDRGDALVKIGSGRGMEVVFTDTSGLWRRLKPGMTLTAMARTPQKATSTATPNSTPVATTPQTAEPEIPVVLKVSDIDAPEPAAKVKKANQKLAAKPAKVEPALIRAAVELAPGATARLRNGMGVTCSLPGANAQSAIRIPAPAIWRDGNQAMVAVLEPVSTQVTPVSQVSGAVEPKNESDVEIDAAMFRVQWRPVALVGQGGEQRQVLSGLKPGDRILRTAADWRRWSQINGENAMVRVALS